MSTRRVANYPLPKTVMNPKQFTGGSFSKLTRDQGPEKKQTPMLTPGPTRYNAGESKLKTSCKNSCGSGNPTFKGAMIGQPTKKDDKPGPCTYNQENGRGLGPRLSFPKGAGHRNAAIKTNGADVFYDVKKGYVDCASLGDGLLLQGGVQGIDVNREGPKTHQMRPEGMNKSRIPPGDPRRPKAPGPGHYAVATSQDCVLHRSPAYSTSKTSLEKSRFPNNVTRAAAWLPPPGTYNAGEVYKNNKMNSGAAITQMLGHTSGFSSGAS